MLVRGVFGLYGIRHEGAALMRKQTLQVVGCLCLANFFAFVIISLFVGGQAHFGEIKSGHYFVAAHEGSRLVEVSETVYNYSYWHFISLFITHPIGMYAGYMLASNFGVRSKIHSRLASFYRRLNERTLDFIFYLLAGNFAAFILISTFIGGTAYFGGIESGHYFLAPYEGAQRVEVSNAVYDYSYIHYISTIISLPIAMCIAWLSKITR
jgi:hypothetical protein